MRTIYGLKMFTLDDITNKIGGRPIICNHLKQHPEILEKFDHSEKLEVNTSLKENTPIYNMAKSLKFIFVSIDLLEERMILDNIVSNMEEVKKMLITVSRAEKVERIVNKHLDSYENFSDRYSGEALLKLSCFMFVYDNDENKLIDVYTAIPVEVINYLYKPIEYQCSVCNHLEKTDNTSFDRFMPDMYYKVVDNEIDYRCKDHKAAGYHHVGE
jgi:hypothetical protein